MLDFNCSCATTTGSRTAARCTAASTAAADAHNDKFIVCCIRRGCECTGGPKLLPNAVGQGLAIVKGRRNDPENLIRNRVISLPVHARRVVLQEGGFGHGVTFHFRIVCPGYVIQALLPGQDIRQLYPSGVFGNSVVHAIPPLQTGRRCSTTILRCAPAYP